MSVRSLLVILLENFKPFIQMKKYLFSIIFSLFFITAIDAQSIVTEGELTEQQYYLQPTSRNLIGVKRALPISTFYNWIRSGLATTTDLNLKFPLSGGTIIGTNGNGFLGLNEQSSPPSTPANGIRYFVDANNNPLQIDEDGNIFQLVPIEQKTTIGSVSASTKKRFVYVVDSASMFYHNGTTLKEFLIF